MTPTGTEFFIYFSGAFSWFFRDSRCDNVRHTLDRLAAWGVNLVTQNRIATQLVVSGAGMREVEPSVLIVEDYSDLAEPLARLMRRMGHSTHVVSNGEEALSYLNQHRPSLVILDLFMPGVSGLEVLRHLRGAPATRELPVIVYTSSSDQDLLEQCAKAGASEIWLKGTLDFFQIMSRISVYIPPPKQA